MQCSYSDMTIPCQVTKQYTLAVNMHTAAQSNKDVLKDKDTLPSRFQNSPRYLPFIFERETSNLGILQKKINSI